MIGFSNEVREKPKKVVPIKQVKTDFSCRPVKSVNKGLCSVCSKPFSENAEVISLATKQTFHIKCIDTWLQRRERDLTVPRTMRKVLKRVSETFNFTRTSEFSLQ